MAKVSRDRPTTGYGSRRESTTSYLSVSPEKYPKRVEELVEKKIASEYHFNKHARLRRIQSDLVSSTNPADPADQQVRLSRASTQRRLHRGDENVIVDHLALSLPAKMSTLDVKDKWSQRSSLSGQSSPISGGGNDDSSLEEDYEDQPANQRSADISPALIRRHTLANQMVSNRIEMNKAKLAMMKKKLSPLPSRHRMKSVPSSDDQ